ncbi:tRNA epoxyqueuosine(34) reductase QueG [Weissella diestrammenae]|uniref:tRNA epoxyqueuosine(34) reductase QueG n=1 Tax=Weissella diestrammenae TaxID=1162633 RepID=A0A7G9T5D0_9LACO|nr:tRNA epoxyqueuosine(34) reductase QueG [Weissella diestrammenae]MCM0583164.1 tRNA epoxyqueuosine(34) reductase QueG [Weissella diestrammenae]QNN75305.1 tRNA epoxyqueuosine(34) reductase QueG [Weissella diestrammenae]
MKAGALKEKIIQTATELGIDKIGFTDASDFSNLKDRIVAQENAGYTSGFEHKIIDERIYPDKIFNEPRTIISIALAYPSVLTERPARTQYKRGTIARASWGEDYHFVLQRKLDALITQIKQFAVDEDPHFKPMVDTGELLDVAVAQRAGVGFVGKNGLLVTPEFGSFVYLGEIITNLELAPDQPMANGCGDCTRCIDGCPTNALLGGGRMNAQRCLSFQTQKRGMVEMEFRSKMHTQLYGCDICQLVCPYNQGIDSRQHSDMLPDPELAKPELIPILDQSNAEFKAKFGKMAGSWRGKKVMQRNAIIALGNLHDRTAIPRLQTLIQTDERPDIRATAVWALGQIMQKKQSEALLDFLKQLNESSELVQNEIQRVFSQYES